MYLVTRSQLDIQAQIVYIFHYDGVLSALNHKDISELLLSDRVDLPRLLSLYSDTFPKTSLLDNGIPG